MNEESIVVTGTGSISSAGLGTDELVETSFSGESCIGEATKFDTSEVESDLAGEVDGNLIHRVIKDRSFLRSPDVTQYVIASAQTAIDDADLEITSSNQDRVGVFYVTCNGCISSTERICENLIESGPGSISALSFVDSVFNAPVSKLSIKCDIQGPVIAFPLGRGGLGAAIEYGTMLIEMDVIDYAIVGGADELNGEVYEAYSYLNVLSPEDSSAEHSGEKLKPYDRERNGFVLSEGGAFMVLEEYDEETEARDVDVYGELAGYSQRSDAYKPADNNPSGEGLSMAIDECLERADFAPGDVDFVAGSGLGLTGLDAMECRALDEQLGEVPVTNVKGLLGDAIGAAQMMHLLLSLECMERGEVPPVYNLTEPEEDCELDFVQDEPRELDSSESALVTGFDWGGVYNSVLVKSWDE